VRRIASAFALVTTLLVADPLARTPGSPDDRHARTVRMMATAYCEQGATKSGVRAQPGVVAADLRRLPLGTKLRVIAPGQTYEGTYTVLDTGPKVRGRNLDIFMTSCARARRFGKRTVEVRILQ